MLHIRSKRTKKAIANEIISRAHKDYLKLTEDDFNKYPELMKDLLPLLNSGEFWYFHNNIPSFEKFILTNFGQSGLFYFLETHKSDHEEVSDIQASLCVLTNNDVYKKVYADIEQADKEHELSVIRDYEAESKEEDFDWTDWTPDNTLNKKPRYINDFQVMLGRFCGIFKYNGALGKSVYEGYFNVSTRMGFFASERFTLE